MTGGLLAALLLIGCGTTVEPRPPVEMTASHGRFGIEPRIIPPGHIRWAADLDEGRRLSRALNKPLFVYVSTTWCGPCKRLKASTFVDPAFVALVNERVVPVAIDAEVEPGKSFCDGKAIRSYPTIAFIRPDGTEIDRTFGYRPAGQMSRVVNDMLADRNTVGDMRRTLARRPDDLALLFKLGQHLALRGEGDEAARMLNRVIGLDSTNQRRYGARAMMALGRYVYLRGGRFEKAEAVYQNLLERFPKVPSAREAAIDLVRILVRRKDKAGAVKVLSAMVAANPKSQRRLLDAAMAVLRNGLDPAAGQNWARAATAHRKDGYPWYLLGQLLMRSGRMKDAEDALRQATQRSPGNATYLRTLEAVRSHTGGKR